MAQAPVVSEYRYRAFISYSHQDKSWADWLHRALETYRVPSRLVGQQTAAGTIPRRLAPIFRDRDELASATDLGRKVNEALGQSENLIVICSPRSAASRWVQEEVLAFRRLGRSERIFCLIIDGEPNASDWPGREAEECFAPALRFQFAADGQPTAARIEPIAADARTGKDSRSKAKLKLIAGMLDIGFDSLRQRELQRRHRRMTMITAAALVVMAVTTALAIRATLAQRAADAASQVAERRQKQAEDLVDFMLGDLNDKLQEVKRLDVMEAVDDKAMAYFTSLPLTDVTDQALAQRAKALEKIGRVREELGHLPEAMVSYQAAAKLTSALAAAAPTDVPRQLQHARILTFIGQNHWFQGQLDEAQASFESAQNVLQQAEPHAANDLVLQFELEMIDNNLGHVLETRGRLDEASGQYKSALALSKELVAANPDKTEWATELGGAHNNLAKLALLDGDLVTAIAEYGNDDAIESGLAERNPKDNMLSSAMLTVRAMLGRTLALVGDDETGMQDLQQAVQMATALVKLDPHNAGFQESLAHYAQQLARLKRLNDDLPSAQALTEQSLSIYLTLVREDPAETSLQRELAEAQIEQAAESLAAGQVDAARAQVAVPLHTLLPLLDRHPHDRSTLLATMAAQVLLATVSTDPAAAAQLRHAVVTAALAQPSGRGDPRLRALQVEAMLALGSKADAEPLIRQLWNSGYRDAALLAVLQREHIAYPVNTTFQQQLLAATSRDER